MSNDSYPPVFEDKSLYIESMDLDAKGIGHKEDGKVVFVDGALPFERVRPNVHRKKNNWEMASLQEIYKESYSRVKPPCPHAGYHNGSCGGCKMQHLEPNAQIAVKQRALEDLLTHIGQVKPQNISRPIEGPNWGYRYRARLSVRDVRKKNMVLIGFHERKSRYVADMQVCPILPSHVSSMLMPLRKLIESLEIREHCAQIELACGDEVTAMVLRHMVDLPLEDQRKLLDFGAINHVQWWLQPQGIDSVHLMPNTLPGSMNRFAEQEKKLAYALPAFGIEMPYRPTDFTQVNPYINQVLVSKAIQLLDPAQDDTVIDWFCGLGNFTLPLATKANQVIGIEGSDQLVQRAKDNYDFNTLQRTKVHQSPLCKVDFISQNLFSINADHLLKLKHAHKWLIDPPREGAFELVKSLVELMAHPSSDFMAPSRIVYVSCNPATLARDAQVLVQGGYELKSAGIINMFPHTAHVESIAVFNRP